jgi:hypothetical protein
VPPPGARSIRGLEWDGVDCRGESALEHSLRLDYEPSQGWSCRITSTSFVDLTGDGIEEALVALDFNLNAIDQKAGARTLEHRAWSAEHVVISLRAGQPELLMRLASDLGEITTVEPANDGLRLELQSCWDCGCDTFEEHWYWDGHRFTVDESRSRQLEKAPDCESP